MTGYLTNSDLITFVFRRNKGIFVKILNINNFDSLNYILNVDSPYRLRNVK